MTNVISLPQRAALTTAARHAALAQCFAASRRVSEDVFWLKENAEFLNIFECTGRQLNEDALSAYATFYTSVADRLAFFPQYYRFLTSIALDLEDLGIGAVTGGAPSAEALCDFVAKSGLPQAELSDLQRAEAMRLLARRGIELPQSDALTARLHSFIDTTASFAVPNQKAAYELTHIFFYLSEYGRRDPHISASARQSLIFTGIIAFLAENADLLAEICVALRYAGETPPPIWETWIAGRLQGFEIRAGASGAGDGYHEYLVLNWAMSQRGTDAFSAPYAQGPQAFYGCAPEYGALRGLSEVLLNWRGKRRSDWITHKDHILDALPEGAAHHLDLVCESTTDFSAFFERFSRSAYPAAGADIPCAFQETT